MAIRTDIFTIDWDSSPRIIWVDISETEAIAQDLYDTCKHYEASNAGMDEPPLCDAEGLAPLGGDVKVGLTVLLYNAQYAFAARPGPDWVICNMTGGNVTAFTDKTRTVELYPRYPTAFVSADRTASSSATTQEQKSIQYSSYGDAVHVDITSQYSGIEHPKGTPLEKVNNLPDALLIDANVGLGTIKAYGDLPVDDSGDYRGIVFYGQSKTKTTFNVAPAAQVEDAEFYDATLTGTLDGDATVHGCVITTLNYFNGYIIQCVFEQGRTTLGGGIEAHILDSWGGESGVSPPEIDLGGSGQTLIMEDFHGRVKLLNKTGPETINIGLSSGCVILDLTTMTNGTIEISGQGHLIDEATGEELFSGTYNGLVVKNKLTNVDNFWHTAIENNFTAHELMKAFAGVLLGEVTGAGTGTEVFKSLDGLTDRVTAVVDEDGNRTSVVIDVS